MRRHGGACAHVLRCSFLLKFCMIVSRRHAHRRVILIVFKWLPVVHMRCQAELTGASPVPTRSPWGPASCRLCQARFCACTVFRRAPFHPKLRSKSSEILDLQYVLWAWCPTQFPGCMQAGLTVLLPHGYDGQGPEHSSARIERFLQMSDENPYVVPHVNERDWFTGGHLGSQIQSTNWQIVNCTTPVNYFHVLRRQVRDVCTHAMPCATPLQLLRAGSSRCCRSFRISLGEALVQAVPGHRSGCVNTVTSICRLLRSRLHL